MGTSSFVIDDGLHEIVFKNNKDEVFAKFAINPADTGMLSRYDSFIEYLDSVNVPNDVQPEDIVRLESDIKQKLDELFNREVSKDIFKVYSPCTMFANGDMYIEVVVRHISDVIESETDVRLKKKIAKIKKATEKNRV